jgi:hypothetical protein
MPVDYRRHALHYEMHQGGHSEQSPLPPTRAQEETFISAQASGPAERLYRQPELPPTDRPRGRDVAYIVSELDQQVIKPSRLP